MTQVQTSFDDLLATAHDLAITVVTGQLGPPMAGQMWIGRQSLDEILCPNQSERQVAFLIAPGGPGTLFVHVGQRVLKTIDLVRLAQDAAASGGSLSYGRLAVLTPALWLGRHSSAQGIADHRSTCDRAKTVGWPANCGDESILFLGDQPIFSLLAQADVGRNVTILVGTMVEPESACIQAGADLAPTHPMLAPPRSTHGTYNEVVMPFNSTPPLRVVQQDDWEQPWGDTPPSEVRARAVGDRVIIRQGRQPITELLGQVGTVVEVFRVPRDSCLVRFDNDPERQREWFFYHDEITTSTA